MIKIPITLSASEAETLLRRIKQWILTTPPTSKERLDELLAKVDSGALGPRYVADTLATLIAENLHEKSQSLHPECYYRWVRSFVEAVQDTLEHLLPFSKKLQINIKGLTEIWVACEPMLDLVTGTEGWQDTTVTIIKTRGVIIKYFLYRMSYYNDLLESLREKVNEDELSLVQCSHIDKPYVPPVALYLGEDWKVGFRGVCRPEIQKTAKGTFLLKHPLDSEWMSFMSSEDTERHFNTLKQFSKDSGGI